MPYITVPVHFNLHSYSLSLIPTAVKPLWKKYSNNRILFTWYPVIKCHLGSQQARAFPWDAPNSYSTFVPHRFNSGFSGELTNKVTPKSAHIERLDKKSKLFNPLQSLQGRESVLVLSNRDTHKIYFLSFEVANNVLHSISWYFLATSFSAWDRERGKKNRKVNLVLCVHHQNKRWVLTYM